MLMLFAGRLCSLTRFHDIARAMNTRAIFNTISFLPPIYFLITKYSLKRKKRRRKTGTDFTQFFSFFAPKSPVELLRQLFFFFYFLFYIIQKHTTRVILDITDDF
ncbi:hypothetical protein V1514DRAFT_331240 [Lipomyces japonicus]|uniref:uncharacterized protein n=1 Tax=Lipomyces japonicus TaxID=56871 RepID=UPI0034CE3C11